MKPVAPVTSIRIGVVGRSNHPDALAEVREGKVHVAIWHEPDGEWLFAVKAQTPEMREALVRALVDAQ